MGADREGGVRRRPVRAVAYAACGAVMLAGCASMPDSGDLRGVESTPRQDSQVRVFAVPPSEDAQPQQIVDGFLEALTSDDPQYETASKYLTPNAAKTWRPAASTTVLASAPDTTPDPGTREDTDYFSFTLNGTKVAAVNGRQAYAPASGSYRQTVYLVRDKKTRQWRIDNVPPGVVMGRSDFQRNYMSVDKYYFASNMAVGTAAQQPAAVADPVYVRRHVDPLTQMVRSLLNGPTAWLGPGVRSSFPTGTTLKKGVTSLTPDDQNKLTVPLNEKAARVGPGKCHEMAAQILFTLQNLTPAVDEVELESGDAQLCTLTEESADTVAARGEVKSAQYLYFVDGKHRLVRMAADSSDKEPETVPGVLGEGETQLRSVAVSRDENRAAAVTADGKTLYVGALASGSSLGEPVLRSAGTSADDRLTTPSFDTQGDLWVADQDPDDPRLVMLEDGAGEPIVVNTPELDGRIESVRVAADGVRIALVVEKDGKQSLLIGRIERSGKVGESQAVSVFGLRSAAPELEEVTAMSWAGDSRLVVVGREEGGVQQMRYAQVDGSTPELPAPAALTGVKEIAASEDDRLPLVAYSEDGIVRLPSGAQWQKVITEGSSPVYPG
ncbi:LpqB family beta-propeller domain-containing protein [Streptomyces sp. NPDC051954]|uniref:LpqB family beta-propeller domain-containing protein n=1 Tax=unclassified Streptomyces TaxID=2593676 RepID=UPI00342A30B7